MPNRTEAEVFHAGIVATVERIFATLDGLSAAEVDWRPPAPGANSLGVLATHILGNLQEMILYQFGGRPLERDRDAEFAAAGTSAEELRARWEQRKAEIAEVFATLRPDALEREYIRPRSGQVLTGRELLLLTAVHAGEHAGHAEMTRDLLRARG